MTYSAPAGNTLQLEHDSTAKQYIITDTIGTRYDVYNDFTVTNIDHRGKLIEQATQGWNEQNKDGLEYTHSERHVPYQHSGEACTGNDDA